jgi:formate hydrogenlyase subunit 3/multisubunit Na+/H+ antiporter MnhD subunit
MILLLPVLILLLGAVTLPVISMRTRARVTHIVALAMAGSYLLVTVSLQWYQPVTITAPLWQPVPLFGAELGYHADSLSLLFALLIGLGLLAGLLSQDDFARSKDDPSHPYGGIFLVAAGGASLIFSADLLALCLSWGFLDLGLLFLTGFLHRGKAASRTGLRLLIINYIGGVALLASLLLLEALGESFSLRATLLPTKVFALLMLAALLRLGLYPALVALPSDLEMTLPTLITWFVTPLAAGGYLLARVLTPASVESPPSTEIVLLIGSLALVLSPFPLWLETSLRRTASYIVLNQVGYLALASAVPTLHSKVIISSQAMSLTLGLTLLFLGRQASREAMARPYDLWTRSCALVGVATLVATPLTLGFVSRLSLYQSLLESGLVALVLLSLLANGWLLAPLLKMFMTPGSEASGEGEVRPLLLAAMTGLAIPLVIMGLYPTLIGRLAGLHGAPSAILGLPILVFSPGSASPLVLTVGMMLSLALGYFMYLKGATIVARAGISLETLKMVAEVEWFYRAVGWTAQHVASILEQFGGFFEGRRSLAWILLFATLVTLLLLSS